MGAEQFSFQVDVVVELISTKGKRVSDLRITV